MAFDPWSDSFEDAMRFEEAPAEEKGKNLADPTRPIFQFFAAKHIEAMRPAIEAGDGLSVLSCIRQCVTHGLVAPEWLAYAFNRRYDAVLRCRANSWDSPLSFGRPYKKGTNINARQKEQVGRFQVYNAIYDKLQKNPETPIVKGLFEEIGAAFGYGATLGRIFLQSP